jgi:hypothetical protein
MYRQVWANSLAWLAEMFFDPSARFEVNPFRPARVHWLIALYNPAYVRGLRFQISC